MNQLNEVDLAFIVDTTGSMGAFITAAQRQMVRMLRELSSAADLSMRLGIVQYRDHPPQDQMVFEAFAFTTNLAEAEKRINKLRPDGGGDGPEAVLDGVRAAVTELIWRPHARRVAVLVGDAPPHGVGYPGDNFARGCPCGETIESVTATVEIACVTLYALGLTNGLETSLGRLARLTGGQYFAAGQGDSAVGTIKTLLLDEFGQLPLDRLVLDAWQADAERFSIDETAGRLGVTSGEVAAAYTRLSARRLIRPLTAIRAVELTT